MGLAVLVRQIGPSGVQGVDQSALLVTHGSQKRQVQCFHRSQELFQGILVDTGQPTGGQYGTGQYFTRYPQLRLAAFWFQAIHAEDEPTVLGCGSFQLIYV